MTETSKLLEESLDYATKRFKAIISTSGDGIIVVTETGIIEEFNSAAEDMFGYKIEEVMGRNVSILMPSPYKENHDKYIQKYVITGIKKVIGKKKELIGLRKDGSTFPIYLSLAEFRVGKDHLFTGIIRDITEEKKAQEELLSHRNKLEYERKLIEDTLFRMRASPDFDNSNLEYIEAPVERTTGDLLMSASNRKRQHIMLGDFTGHGLPAALASPVVSDTFYSMVSRGFAAYELLHRINEKLCEKLPSHLYMAGVILTLNKLKGKVRIVNCGLPPVLHFRNGVLIDKIESSSLPLGIKGAGDPEELTAHKVLKGDKLIIYTDGFTEASDPDGDMFNTDSLINVITNIYEHNTPISLLKKVMRGFRYGTPQEDDMTLVEVTV